MSRAGEQRPPSQRSSKPPKAKPKPCATSKSPSAANPCQLATIALKANRKLAWDPAEENFGCDAAANKLMRHRPKLGEWRLPVV